MNTRKSVNLKLEDTAAELKGSLIKFCKFFFPLMTGRDFILSNPVARETHFITIARELTKAARLQIPSQRLIINVPPGHGKSVMLSMWVAWTLAKYPDSNYLYISYSQKLAAKHTNFIRQIICSRHYQHLFEVSLRADSRAKESFTTTAGGSIGAFGASGSITGQDAGLPNLNRFSGAVIIDDPHKPDEVHSDVMRKAVIDNYRETIQQRARGVNVPFIFIGQRLHEDDLAAYLINGHDGYEWEKIILKAIDEAGNALYPEAVPLEALHIKQERDIYVFSSQYQQDPQPAGGALFKPEWFVGMDEEPKILKTFITADTAETSKSYNDATVFSFWGLYEIETFGHKTGELGLHWLDTLETRIEPRQLQDEFISFYQSCVHHPVPPLLACIEKKSTGVTLISVLEDIRGLQIRDIQRTRASGSKAQRFLEIQPHVAAKKISYTKGAKHIDNCIEHMRKITANDSHRFDDICFVAGTKIATKYGDKKIEDIKKGDKIITPFGWCYVSGAGITGCYPVVEKIGLTGTKNHPVFSNNEFKSIDSLADDDKVSYLSFKELFRWQYRKLLLSMELNIDLWDRNAIILVSQKTIRKGKVPRDCMLRCGSFIAARKFRKAILFIIKVMTHLITTLKIWSVYRAGNILKTMRQIACDGIIVKRAKGILNTFKSKLKNGINLKKGANGTEKTLKQAYCNNANTYAMSVNNHFQELNVPNIALKNATTLKKQKEHEKKEQKKEVYNLTVEIAGVYYANGILVSNCDTVADAVKLGLIDKTIYRLDSDIGNTQADISGALNHRLQLRSRVRR